MKSTKLDEFHISRRSYDRSSFVKSRISLWGLHVAAGDSRETVGRTYLLPYVCVCLVRFIYFWQGGREGYLQICCAYNSTEHLPTPTIGAPVTAQTKTVPEIRLIRPDSIDDSFDSNCDMNFSVGLPLFPLCFRKQPSDESSLSFFMTITSHFAMPINIYRALKMKMNLPREKICAKCQRHPPAATHHSSLHPHFSSAFTAVIASTPFVEL